MGMPLGMLIAGPLADRIFEPSMMPQGSLAPIFGGLIGTGPGSGMSLMLVVAGFIGAIAGLGAYGFRALRNAEDVLPDFNA